MEGEEDVHMASFNLGYEVEIGTSGSDHEEALDDNQDRAGASEEDEEAADGPHQDENVNENHPSSQPNSQEMDQMVLESSSTNTHKATQWGVKKFEDWAAKQNRVVDLETVSTTELNDILRRFYAGVKGKKGQPLTPSGLTGIRAAIHRKITQPPLSRNINILADVDFTSSNQMFTARCRLYYKSGNRRPAHKPAIEDGDMEKLEEYFKNWTTTPQFLWNIPGLVYVTTLVVVGERDGVKRRKAPLRFQKMTRTGNS